MKNKCFICGEETEDGYVMSNNDNRCYCKPECVEVELIRAYGKKWLWMEGENTNGGYVETPDGTIAIKYIEYLWDTIYKG